jgi:hypothetical protein
MHWAVQPARVIIIDPPPPPCAFVPQDQRESTGSLAEGNLRYNGKLIREKGDFYQVPANVTGSNEGTSTNPKFALLNLWKHRLLPIIDHLTSPGQRYHGVEVVLQQDNAGPHLEGSLNAFLDAEIAKRPGWKRSDQAPQGPYCNVLDLAIFPSMSKQHSKLLQQNNNTAVKKEKIMATANKVWSEMASWKVANGFILAYRVMKKIIENKGKNQWLSSGAPHLQVREHFKPTKMGASLKAGGNNLGLCCECDRCLGLRARAGFIWTGSSNPIDLVPKHCHGTEPLYCSEGCGFYGDPSHGGMCSKCVVECALNA